MKSVFLTALAFCGVALANTLHAQAPAPAWNVRDHIPADRILVQSHRGAGVLAEESTLEAFELGWSLGTIPEADLRMTKDRVIVSFHDNTLARVVKDASPELKKKGVQDLTWGEVSKLDVGSWRGEQFKDRRVLLMAKVFEVLRDHPGRRIYMDVKKVDFTLLADEVRKYGITRQLILAGKNSADLRAWKALVPEADTLLWMHGNEATLRKSLEKLTEEKFDGITQIQIHVYPKETKDTWAPAPDPSPAEDPFRLPSAFLKDTGNLLRTHKVLFQTFPYTESPTAIPQLLDLGVMSFATDHPDVVMREIKAYYEKK